MSSPLGSTHPAAHDGFPELPPGLQAAPWVQPPGWDIPPPRLPARPGNPLPVGVPRGVLEQKPRAQPAGRRATALAARSPAKASPEPRTPRGARSSCGEPPRSPALGVEAAGGSRAPAGWGARGGESREGLNKGGSLQQRPWKWALCSSRRENRPDCPICWGPESGTRSEVWQLRAGLGPQQRVQELQTPCSSC